MEGSLVDTRLSHHHWGGVHVDVVIQLAEDRGSFDSVLLLGDSKGIIDRRFIFLSVRTGKRVDRSGVSVAGVASLHLPLPVVRRDEVSLLPLLWGGDFHFERFSIIYQSSR